MTNPTNPNEFADAPDFLEGRWRRSGATDEEVARLRADHEAMPYEDRYRANVNARGIDDPGILNSLLQYRARWADEDAVAEARGNVTDESEGEGGAPAAPPSDIDAYDVPGGTVQDVLDWVGIDPDRARAALIKEQESGDPRSSLVTKLEARAGVQQ